MTTSQPRKPAGTPTGGQFAPPNRPRPNLELEPPATIDGRPVEPEITPLSNGKRIETYSCDGQIQDPDDGRPAVVSYRRDGTVERETHYRDGQVQDPDDRSPAVVWRYPDGTVER